MTHICWARTVPGLTPTARHVLSTLAGAADDAALAYPGIKTLETWTGLGRATIYRAIKILENEALIEVIRTDGKGNGYLLLMDESAPSHTATRLTQRPVSHSDPSQSETKPVSHSDKTRLTVRPKRFLKDLKGGDISPEMAVAVSSGKTAKNDDAYKRQSATWVEPEPATQAAHNEAVVLWNATKEQLALELPKATYDAYLAQATAVSYDGAILEVTAPNPSARAFLEFRMINILPRTLKSITGHAVSVRILQLAPS